MLHLELQGLNVSSSGFEAQGCGLETAWSRVQACSGEVDSTNIGRELGGQGGIRESIDRPRLLLLSSDRRVLGVCLCAFAAGSRIDQEPFFSG